jgi:hypothetical protein
LGITEREKREEGKEMGGSKRVGKGAKYGPTREGGREGGRKGRGRYRLSTSLRMAVVASGEKSKWCYE